MRFSFRYGGIYYSSDQLARTGEEIYELGDLRVTRILKTYPGGAVYSLCYYENTGKENSEIVSDILDIDDEADIRAGIPPVAPGFTGHGNPGVRIYRTVGSNCDYDEFRCLEDNPWLCAGGNRYSALGGRSSDGGGTLSTNDAYGVGRGYAPFFEVYNGVDCGVLLAIGWSGQWTCRMERRGEKVYLAAGIERTAFYLYPGEKVRTASVLLLPFVGTRQEGHNAFRRLIKEYFTPLGRERNAPLSMQTWGGARSDFLISAAQKNSRFHLGFEYFWVDAGWNGNRNTSSGSEHDGDWEKSVGDWNVNRFRHSDGLRQVAEEARKNNMKLLLWFEPERASVHSSVAAKHPEFFLRRSGEEENLLLDLGREDAWKHVYDLLSMQIRELDVSCYRQDFNMDPLVYWRENDEPGRSGMKEIGHINGLYRLWDALRERFPHLIIDNCASGGRRIDLETVSRSVPLWRSDAQCQFDVDPALAQNQNLGLSQWLPYHGGGMGPYFEDKYRARSNYAAAFACNRLGYEFESFDCDEERLAILRERIVEYKSVRRFFSEDFYPVFGYSGDNYGWSGWQFHDRNAGEGVLMAFRREDSPCSVAEVFPGGIEASANYCFLDADTGENAVFSGKHLIEDGFSVTLEKKRSSKLFTYRRVRT